MVFVVLATLLTILVCSVGCQANKAGEHFAAAGAAADRIGTRTTFIDDQVKQISGHAPQKRTITEQTAAIRTDASVLQIELANLRRDFERLAKQLQDLVENGWVKFALAAQHAWHWLVAIIVIGNILAILIGISPWAGAQALGKELVRLLPFMNFAAWIRDWINKRKLLKAQLSDRLHAMGQEGTK